MGQIIGDTLNEGSLYGRVPTGLATNETYLAQVVASEYFYSSFSYPQAHYHHSIRVSHQSSKQN